MVDDDRPPLHLVAASAWLLPALEAVAVAAAGVLGGQCLCTMHWALRCGRRTAVWLTAVALRDIAEGDLTTGEDVRALHGVALLLVESSRDCEAGARERTRARFELAVADIAPFAALYGRQRATSCPRSR